jgi:hypothetical protein
MRSVSDCQVGRGLRRSSDTGKTDCLILDLVGNCDRLALGVKPDLDGRLGPDLSCQFSHSYSIGTQA